MKKIVFIRAMGVYYCSRSIKEIFALVEKGYHIVVLCWDREGNSEQLCKEVFGSISANVEFRFFRNRVFGGLGLKKIDVLFKWILWVKNELAKIEGVDYVHACDLDAGLGAYLFCKKNNKKLVYDIFDYYIDSHPVPNILRDFVEWLEISIINFSSATIICTEERFEQISKSSPRNVCVIHNSPDINVFNNDLNDIDYAYCGVLSTGRLICEILNNYDKNNDIKVKFSGPGEYRALAEDVSKREKNFEYIGVITYPKVLEIEKKAKVLSAIYEPTKRNHRLCAPNKFYEALALGKPLIVCKGTGIDKVVEKYNIGFVIDYNAYEFYNALRILINDESMRKDMGVKARKLYEDRYNWSIMKQRLVDLYSEI